ncbi:glycosyltransferase [Calditrichota bacterium LG25]
MGKETKINVLHLETALEWRGGQQQIAYLVQGLLRAGINTALVAPPAAKVTDYFRKNALPFLEVKVRHGWDLQAARKIARFIGENRSNILHAHSSHALSLGLLVKLLAPSVKLIASRRVDFSVKKPLVGALKYNNRLIDRIVCISENIANVLTADGVNPAKLSVIHSGIDPDRFKAQPAEDFRKELGISREHLVVGTVAALVGHKDYPTLLRAAALVVKRHPRVTFCAVGEGADRPQLEELHRRLGLGDRFRFVGFRADLDRFYALFDVFALSSYKEGLGTSVLDALACGLPVVASRAGGIVEMIEDEKNGLLVPPRDEQALASALLRLLQDEALRKRLSRNARPSVEKFSFNRMVDKHIRLYEQLLAVGGF